MKKFLLIFISILFLTGLSAQETDAETTITEPETEAQTSEVRAAKFVMQFEPGFYINTASTLISAPSPIIYPITLGFIWPEQSTIAIQPAVSFFMMQHLYYDDMALPAEIENRTTTTLSFMLNIPAVYSLFLENSRFQFSGGAGIFMRFGILSPGVEESDSGWTGSAGEDVAKINEYFWGNMRWFYLTFGASWLYDLTPQLRAGPVMNFYLPVGGLISDKTVQGMLISVGIKICR